MEPGDGECKVVHEINLQPEIMNLPARNVSINDASSFRISVRGETITLIDKRLVAEAVRTPKMWYIIRYDDKFRKALEWTVVLGVIWNMLMVPYDVAYQPYYNSGAQALFSAIDAIFWVDLIVLFFTSYLNYRGEEIVSHVLIVQNYLRTWFCVDLMACIPFEYLSVLVPVNQHLTAVFQTADAASHFVFTCFRLNRLLRIFKLVKFLNSFQTSHAVQLIKLGFYFCVIGHVAAAVFYLVGKVQVLDPNALYHVSWIEYYNLDAIYTLIEKHILSMTWSVSTLLQIGPGDYVPKTVPEIAWVITVLLLGEMVNTIIIGNGMLLFEKMIQDSTRKTDMLHSVAEYLKYQEASTECRAKVRQVLARMWNKNRFYIQNQMLATLPISTQSHIVLEMHGELIRNASLFKLAHVDSAFIRHLFPYVQHQVAMKGDVLWYEGDVQEDIVFIRKGSISISAVSREHKDNVVESGEMVGEFLFISGDPLLSPRTVAASDCDLIFIAKKSLEHVLSTFPKIAKKLGELAEQRQKGYYLKRKKDFGSRKTRILAKVSAFSKIHPRSMVDMSHLIEQMEEEDASSDVTSSQEEAANAMLLTSSSPLYSQSIKWDHNIPIIDKRYGPNGRYGIPTTKFRGAVKLIIASNKMRAPWGSRFVIRPSSAWKQRWDWAVVGCMMFTAILTPMNIAFEISDYGSPLYIVGSIADSVVIINLCITFITGYYDKHGNLIIDLKLISKRYLQSSFVIDFISTVPMDLLFQAFGASSLYFPRFRTGEDLLANRAHAVPFASLLKLFRLLQLRGVLRKVQTVIRGKAFRLFQIFFLFCLFCHWFGCLLYLESRLQESEGAVLGRTPWVINADLCPDKPSVEFGNLRPSTCTQYPTFGERYLVSFYFSVVTVTTTGYGDIVPSTMTDRMVVVLIVLVSMLMRSAIFGNMANVIASLDRCNTEREDLLEDLAKYMRLHECSEETKSSVKDTVNLYYLKFKGFNARELLSILPFNFRADVCESIYAQYILGSQLMHNLDKAFIKEVYNRLRPMVILPGQTIFNVGDKNLIFFFVSSGRVVLQSGDTLIRYLTLECGGSFGEVSILTGEMTYSAAAVETTTLYYLSTQEIQEVLAMFPRISSILQHRAKVMLETLKHNLENTYNGRFRLREATLLAYKAQLEGQGTSFDSQGVQHDIAMLSSIRDSNMTGKGALRHVRRASKQVVGLLSRSRAGRTTAEEMPKMRILTRRKNELGTVMEAMDEETEY